MSRICCTVARSLPIGKNRTRILLDELKICGRTKNLERAREIHAKCRNDTSIYIANSLIHMYVKCGSMFDARKVFDSIKVPSTVSWNTLILGYAENGEGVNALDLFSRMKLCGCVPDAFTFGAAIKSCASLASEEDATGRQAWLERGKQIHSDIGCHLDIYVQSSLIDMYAKCGSMRDARRVFDSMKHPDIVSWNALMLGYAENGEGATALNLFSKMVSQSCVPDLISFVAALKACTSLAVDEDENGRARCLQQGKRIHSMCRCYSSTKLQNTLIDMYSKCGSMIDARQVFNSMNHPDVVSWNALILGYAGNGQGVTGLDLFASMKSEGCAQNSVTFIAALKACTSLIEPDGTGAAECRERGTQIHSEIGFHFNINVINTLMDMYSSCGSMVDARQVFDSMKDPTVVSWNVLILGYAENGEGVIALDLFSRMRSQGYVPNSRTYAAALKTCSLLGALEPGIKIHVEMNAITKLDVILVTCLVEFYAKCGCLEEAQRFFNYHLSKRDLKTWNALLAGYSRFGDSKHAFGLFEGMQESGLRPNSITFLCIFMCCSHAGLVEKGKECFEAMATKYKISPNVEHYNCMLDIIGRSNKLDDATALLRSMHCKPNAVTWRTVLGTCCKWKNVGIGRLAFKSLISLDNTNAVAYVLMGHIYGSRSMWEEQDIVLGMKEYLKIWKRDAG